MARVDQHHPDYRKIDELEKEVFPDLAQQSAELREFDKQHGIITEIFGTPQSGTYVQEIHPIRDMSGATTHQHSQKIVMKDGIPWGTIGQAPMVFGQRAPQAEYEAGVRERLAIMAGGPYTANDIANMTMESYIANRHKIIGAAKAFTPKQKEEMFTPAVTSAPGGYRAGINLILPVTSTPKLVWESKEVYESQVDAHKAALKAVEEAALSVLRGAGLLTEHTVVPDSAKVAAEAAIKAKK